ncbi:unnamed protein product [Acanthoscelides obtectus]|uniref:Uncharacterized protein n=1 Tax=Acanthoscelides obtectus TaxID=200917 RepID=A0A9P0K804_ACAOB|nr:unnamed protein product [Acanthoscelides obtectus]CAK1633564.1 hypothetical protein AOBTE_LOCUS8225 [Acanthoscelides obtectus]
MCILLTYPSSSYFKVIFQGHISIQGHISRIYFKVAFQGHVSRLHFKVTFRG